VRWDREEKKDVIDVVENSIYVVARKRFQEGVKDFICQGGKGAVAEWCRVDDILAKELIDPGKNKEQDVQRRSQDMVGEGVWPTLDLF